MTLLTICKGLALNVGMTVPDVVATSPAREWAEALQMANEAGDELARRADWGVLQGSTTLIGNGSPMTFALSFVSRLNDGVTVKAASAIVRPLERAEWNTLSAGVAGTPRYFLHERQTIQFWPHLANLAQAIATHQITDWCTSGTKFATDDDISVLDEGLLLKGLIVRWRRQKGMDYADQEAEYEATLQQLADFDSRSRL